MVLHDLKLAAPNDANKPKTSIALLNSTYSTLITTDGAEVDVFPITVFIYYIYISLIKHIFKKDNLINIISLIQ